MIKRDIVIQRWSDKKWRRVEVINKSPKKRIIIKSKKVPNVTAA